MISFPFIWIFMFLLNPFIAILTPFILGSYYYDPTLFEFDAKIFKDQLFFDADTNSIVKHFKETSPVFAEKIEKFNNAQKSKREIIEIKVARKGMPTVVAKIYQL